MEPRGRGRARGRARGGPQSGQGPRPGSQPQPQQPVQPQQQPQQPRQQPQQPRQQPQQSQQQPQQSQQQPQQSQQQSQQPRQQPQQPRQQPQQPQQQPQQPQQQPQGVQGSRRTRGARNRPQEPQVPQQQGPQSVPSASGSGRGARIGAGDSGETSTSTEQAGATGEAGEGAGESGSVRGRSYRSEIIHTKPEEITSKQGSSGTLINLTANLFALLHAGKWGLLQYHVHLDPDVDHTGYRKGIVKDAMRSVLSGYLFDGTVLYTPFRIQPEPLEKLVQRPNGDKIRVILKLVGDLVWGDWHYIQLFNLIIRKCLTHMKLELVGRNYFDPHKKFVLSEHQLELWPGYYTSMRQYEDTIMMNVELTFKVMRQDNCYDLLLSCSSANQNQEFKTKLLGSIVLTYYNNKTYKIDDVDFESSPASSFTLKDGTKLTFIEYYKKKYNIRIDVLRQPMLISFSKPREIRAGMPDIVTLVPSLCQLTGLTDRQRENYNLMRTLAEYTRIVPQSRLQKLYEFSQKMQRNKEVVEELRRWDLTLANDLVKFRGRVLDPETIFGGNQVKYSGGPQADFNREVRTTPMFSTIQLRRFAVVTPRRERPNTTEFIKILQRCATGMSWNIGQPRIYEIIDEKVGGYLAVLEDVIKGFDPTLILCVLSNNSSERYSMIKKRCYVEASIPSQIILSKNLRSKGVMSIATKVAIQMNCKIGGAPWTVAVPLTYLMVVGYDVCLDPSLHGKTFSAMVASMNRQMTTYYSISTQHQMGQELSHNFGNFMVSACRYYKQINNRFPERIVIYRDGVGEGQLSYVFEIEVISIKKRLLSDIYENKDELRMAFVVVSKRIHLRLFTERGNPPPGTVADDVVTLPQRYDFYIVSQCVRQGTVTPTSYNIIFDTMGLSPDRMQMLTYKLCHMYYNWCGTVRVPAPCQYAHKLALLTATGLGKSAHHDLAGTLYYL